MSATLKDIAVLLGLSESTVSRALNNHPQIRPETRARVLRAARELGYRPNALARGLAVNRTNVIGLVISDIGNPFFSAVTRGIELVAEQEGYNTILCNTLSNPAKELRYIDVLSQRQVDGIIFMSGRLPPECVEALKECGRPVVVIGRNGTRYGLPSIRIDNPKEAARITSYLINLGHTRIGLLMGPRNDEESGLSRFVGYKQALERNRIPFDPELVKEGDFSLQSGFRGMMALLGLEDPPTAVFAANDAMAIGAIKAINASGLRVPKDVSVVGFDNTYLAEMSEPALTTVAQPLAQIGVQAMNLLRRLIHKEELDQFEIILDCELIVRESCGGLN